MRRNALPLLPHTHTYIFKYELRLIFNWKEWRRDDKSQCDESIGPSRGLLSRADYTARITLSLRLILFKMDGK